MNNRPFTFTYSGREPVTVHEFLTTYRPDVSSLYIYDIMLSSGAMLYACKGGIGVTKERYIVEMHQAIKSSTFASAYKELCFPRLTKPAYFRLREKFNAKYPKITGQKDSVALYALWAHSSFLHRYRNGFGYDAEYFPNLPSSEQVRLASSTAREKNLLFRREDIFSFSESIIHTEVVLYAHLPTSFGAYGADFLWNKRKLKHFGSVVSELCELGRKVCVSIPCNRATEPVYPANIFPSLLNKFKVSGLVGSDLYLLNF